MFFLEGGFVCLFVGLVLNRAILALALHKIWREISWKVKFNLPLAKGKRLVGESIQFKGCIWVLFLGD